jgi:hypothetical protein
MKITIKASCIGKDGEHLEQGTTVDYPEAAALVLTRLGRAVSDEEAEPDAGGEETAEADELLKKTKAELLELASAEEVEIKPSANKEQIVEAILLKRSAAA